MSVMDQVCEVASDVFGVPPGSLGASSSPETVESWDSVFHLNFALALESRFGVSMDPEDIEAIKSVGDAAKIVEGKLAGR